MEVLHLEIGKYRILDSQLKLQKHKLQNNKRFAIIGSLIIAAIFIIDNYIFKIFTENKNQLLLKLVLAGLFFALLRAGRILKRMIDIKSAMHNILLQQPAIASQTI